MFGTNSYFLLPFAGRKRRSIIIAFLRARCIPNNSSDQKFIVKDIRMLRIKEKIKCKSRKKTKVLQSSLFYISESSSCEFIARSDQIWEKITRNNRVIANYTSVLRNRGRHRARLVVHFSQTRAATNAPGFLRFLAEARDPSSGEQNDVRRRKPTAQFSTETSELVTSSNARTLPRVCKRHVTAAG